MPEIRELARRWAQRVPFSPDALVDELTVDDITFVDLGEGLTARRGRAERRLLEQRRYQVLPDRRYDVTAVLDDGAGGGVVEWLVSGTSSRDITRMAAPAVSWWQVQGSTGRIASEWSILDWSARRLDTRPPSLRNEVDVAARPPRHVDVRSQGWYRDLAARWAETWTWNPELMAASVYADGVAASSALCSLAAELHTANPRLSVLASLGDGAALALRVRIDAERDHPFDEAAPPLRWGVVLVSLDVNDRVAEERCYLAPPAG